MDIRIKAKDNTNSEIPVICVAEENAVSLLGQEGCLTIAKFEFPKVLNNGDSINLEYNLIGE